jgi:hypothetical protein
MAAADQARRPVHAVRDRGLHPSDTDRAERPGIDLAAQRGVRIDSHLERARIRR